MKPSLINATRPSLSLGNWLTYGLFLGACVLYVYWSMHPAHFDYDTLLSDGEQGVCPQAPAISLNEMLDDLQLSFPSVRQSSERLSRAIQHATTVSDSWPDPDDDDSLWSQRFPAFAHWLTRAFPAIHRANSPIRREKIHKHGLLYTWEGSDPSLKPLLLMAHQDVVPVENSTWDQWTFPPFSGHIDLERQAIWGRGAVDCKQYLIGILSAVETLAQSKFRPKRTVLMGFGFDEEVGGDQGAAHMSRFLEERYGQNSLALIRTLIRD